MVAPVIPGLNDHELAAILQAAQQAGADLGVLHVVATSAERRAAVSRLAWTAIARWRGSVLSP